MRLTVREIRETLQKPRESEELYAWFVTRRLSALVTWALQGTPVTPNTVTVWSIVLAVTGGGLYATGTTWGSLIGALTFQLWYVLDCVDGELARLKGASSREGVYLDVVGHYIADAFMIGGFSLGVYNAVKQPWVLYVGFLFVVAYLVSDLLDDLAFKVWFLQGTGARPRRRISALFQLPRNGLARRWTQFFGLIPRRGYCFHMIHIMNMMALAAVLDWLVEVESMPYVWSSLLLLIYSVCLSISVIGRLRVIVVNRTVSTWLDETET